MIKKYFDYFSKGAAIIFVIASAMLFLLPLSGVCNWEGTVFGPIIQCKFDMLEKIISWCSVLSIYWFLFIVASAMDSPSPEITFLYCFGYMIFYVLVGRGFILLLFEKYDHTKEKWVKTEGKNDQNQ